ncbi:acyltransferase [Herbiconiux moechotypicola]|uniref:Acyltransferase 3 domain-containing protein n=1 Tax=Herbiconiux moechotypicola TaxID=637393 RepID=A0ABN3DH11_9MICO|nr:acyltransferase [Herbiconiux moechotypicola]MCS5729569.1 acyltransferase [Herbiconiux moechotypicola]
MGGVAGGVSAAGPGGGGTHIGGAGGRAVWIDVARGVCVILVVLLHVRIFVFEPLVPEEVDTRAWREFTEFFGPFRLPLLFALSGLLVSERVRHGWGDRRNLLRVASSYWIYLVWLTVFALMSLAVTASGVPFKIHSVPDYLLQLVLPDTILWFVFALAVYVAVLTTLHRVPWPVVLGVFAAVAVGSGLVPASDAEAMWVHMLYFGVFFAVGVHLPRVLVWLAGGRMLPKLLVCLVAFVGLLELWELTSLGDMLESGLRLVRDAAAIALAVVVCSLVSRVPGVSRVLAGVGRRTLPVYVMQLPWLWALYLLPFVRSLHGSDVALYLGPVVATAVIVGGSLLLHAGMERTPLRYAFRLPPVLVARILGPVGAGAGGADASAGGSAEGGRARAFRSEAPGH